MDNLLGGGVICGIPVVPVLVNGVVQGQNGIKESIANGTELKASGKQLGIGLLLLGQAIEEIGGIAGGSIEIFRIVGDDIVIAEGFLGLCLRHRLINGIKNDHVVPGAITGVDVDMHYIFIFAVQALVKHIL